MINRNSVIIKTNAYGLILILDPDVPFDKLLYDVAEKFMEASRFFRNAQMALTFQGRELTREEERALVYTISENSSIHIVCIVDQKPDQEEYYKEAVTRQLTEDQQNNCWIHRGTIRNGQVLDIDRTVLILGDVNPGAQVISTGSIIIIGCCMGNLTAGSMGDPSCFAAGIVLKPNHIRIADKSGASAITKRVDTGEYTADPTIIYINGDKLRQEPLTSKVFANLIRKEMDHE